MDPQAAAWSLVGLALVASVGRTALSLLPPGGPGRHDARTILATWATSHLLGLLALAVTRSWLLDLDVDPGPVTVLGPWVLIALARVLTLPGALVPGYTPAAEGPGLPARGARVAVLVLWVLPLARRVVRGVRSGGWGDTAAGQALGSLFSGLSGEQALLERADVLALLILLDYGLVLSRRPPFTRWIALAWVAWLFNAPNLEPRLDELGLLGGAAFSIGWLRRGDRRALALATLSFGGAALGHPAAAAGGLFGLVALVVTTPRPSRRLATWLALASFVLLALRPLHEAWLDEDPGWSAAALRELGAVYVPHNFQTRWFVALLVLGAGSIAALRVLRLDRHRRFRLRPELALVFSVAWFVPLIHSAAAAALLNRGLGALEANDNPGDVLRPATLGVLVPIAALLAAATLGRAEKTAES